MVTIAYKLTPKSAFHFGREGLEQHSSSETFSSDSLFSALIATTAQVEPESIDGVLGAFPPFTTIPALRLSSVFPIAGDLPLFPKPRLKIEMGKDDVKRGKDLKKIQYVSVGILNLLLKNADMDKSLSEDEGRFLQDGAVWLTKAEQTSLPKRFHTLSADALKAEKIWDEHLTPRVTIDRMNNSSNVYQTGRTIFTQGCGLWFMADVVSEDVKLWLNNMLFHLADDGIGGERSAGYGGFDFESITVPTQPNTDSKYVMLLSRYSPTRDELVRGLFDERCAYELVDVGGWLATPGARAQKRQRVRLIEVGSVIRGGTLTGQLVDVSPTHPLKHPVFRSGIALTILVGGK